MQAQAQGEVFTVHEHLFQIYPDIPRYTQQHPTIQKFETINKRFSFKYAKNPQYFAKCPGAITLFGDQGDYSGLSFLECCTSNDVVVAVAPNSLSEIRVNHFQKSRYPQEVVSLSESQLKENQEWRNNIVLAIKINRGMKVKVEQGVDVLVYTDLMDKADMSKTTALVYSLVLGIAAVNGGNSSLRKDKLLQEINKFQQKFPTLNPRKSLLYGNNNRLIDSVTQETMVFPSGYSLVMAHSCTPNSPKLLQIREGRKLNLRRCEVKLGIELVKAQLGIEKDINNMRQLRESLGYTTEQMLDCIEEYVPNKSMTPEELQSTAQRSLIQMLKSIPYSNNVIDYQKSFHPYNSTMYILKEQVIIDNLKKAFSSNSSEETKATTLQQAFKQSWKLQQELLEGQPELVTKLIEVAVQIPSANVFKLAGDTSRGNVMFLVEKSKAQELKTHLQKEYYSSPQLRMCMSDSVQQYIYEVTPAQGLSLLDPQYEIWL